MSVWKSFAAAAAIAAGGFPGTAAAQAVDITIMTSYGPNQSRGQVLQELVDQFNAEHEGEIAVELQVDPDHPAMQAKLRTMIAAGAPPDISHCNFNPNDLAIPTSGELLDFSRYMDDAWRSRFNEGDLERFTFDGALVSLPFQQSPALLYYNKDLFQKAGIGSFPKSGTSCSPHATPCRVSRSAASPCSRRTTRGTSAVRSPTRRPVSAGSTCSPETSTATPSCRRSPS